MSFWSPLFIIFKNIPNNLLSKTHPEYLVQIDFLKAYIYIYICMYIYTHANVF